MLYKKSESIENAFYNFSELKVTSFRPTEQNTKIF